MSPLDHPTITVMTGDLSLRKLTEFWIPQYTLNPCWLIQKCWCDESIPGKRQPGLNTPTPSVPTYTDTLTLVKLKTPAHFPGLRQTWLGVLLNTDTGSIFSILTHCFVTLKPSSIRTMNAQGQWVTHPLNLSPTGTAKTRGFASICFGFTLGFREHD